MSIHVIITQTNYSLSPKICSERNRVNYDDGMRRGDTLYVIIFASTDAATDSYSRKFW